MKIAIIGSTGLLGSAIKRYLKDLNIESLLLDHNSFDITDQTQYDIFVKNGVDIVINTAAYLGVEPCEANPIDAFELNTKAVADLSRYCKNNDITLAQISTDGVFDGVDKEYDENANPRPVNMYGFTKYGAEQFVQNLCKKYYIFRIPILFGSRENKGNIFIEKMYNLYKNGKKELKIADDVISRPSYAEDVAEGVVKVLINNREFGLYHIFNGGDKASLYDFAVEFFKLKNINDIRVDRAKASEFSQNELGVKPSSTILQSVKSAPLRDWREAMKEYINKEDNVR